MTRPYVCVHGHFYQPPREDPETQQISRETAAAPFHDFNEKILAECYRPNADLGNFDQMSFDLGPTLGQWLQAQYPEVLARIVEGDRRAVARGGSGNALMQSFHHTILPLASGRDRQTELHWGRRWFELVFGRAPKGIWLPETAIDLATLEACVDEGLSFTILSPDQADKSVDPQRPYRVALPSGRSFVVLFYEGPLSGTVSFDPAATNDAGEFLRHWVLPPFRTPREPALDDPLVLIASDGEVYGHHHPFKDHFLHDLLSVQAPAAGLTVVSAERYLAGRDEASFATTGIKERSSWGCGHELLRWRGDCACTPGDGHWKAELRAAFDDLAARVDQVAEEVGRRYGADVWALRDNYVEVVLGRITLDRLLQGAGLAPSGGAAEDLAAVLDAQRHRLAMYASCAFYWDDLTRIEAGYGVRSGLYAAKLLDRHFGTDTQSWFAERLDHITGWKSELSAAELYVSRG